MSLAAVAPCTAAAAWLTGAAACASTQRPSLVVSAPAAPSSPRPGRRARGDRRRAMSHEVPQFLDLLAAGSTAGLSAEASFRQAATSVRGPLADELGEVLRSIDLGVPWRSALTSCVDRTGDPDLARTVQVLARSETLGVPLRDATRDLAATVRGARRATTMERARTAPVRMLFPLVFLILPAFLLLTVVPVLITTVRAIH